jgi:flagellar biosynthesis component FlhA
MKKKQKGSEVIKKLIGNNRLLVLVAAILIIIMQIPTAPAILKVLLMVGILVCIVLFVRNMLHINNESAEFFGLKRKPRKPRRTNS